jgi:hypothetical protein
MVKFAAIFKTPALNPGQILAHNFNFIAVQATLVEFHLSAAEFI